MFSRILNEQTKICLTTPQFAEDLFALTDKERDALRQWLPWLDHVASPQDTREFIVQQLGRFAASEALHTTIFFEDRIAGVLAFNTIDAVNQAGHLGYWLGSEFQGKGIMTECVKELMVIGETFYSLKRFEIRCATENTKSRAIPERLGFVEEGTIRKAEKVYENWYDHVVYGKVTLR